MKILIADDNNTDRLILKTILKKAKHEVLAAVDGVQAVALFREHQPDIVLLDAMMPNLDGYGAAEQIKQEAGEYMVPIIFLTSLQEASALAKCLEVGGDDFLTKPYNKIILHAKIEAFVRLKNLYNQVREQRNEIQLFTDQMVQDQEVAKRVFDNIAHSDNLKQRNIQHLLSPMSIFNGDVLLCAEAASGSSHILLGDFTGHGLPAAIGALPVAEIFYGMTIKGFSIPDIIMEINSRLSSILPVGVFCCATACEVNYRDNFLTVWSGGLPDAYILSPGGDIIETIKSKHLPLGVLKSGSFSIETDVFPLKQDDKLFICSDGIIEAEAPDGSLFGEQRLLATFEQSNKENNLFHNLIKNVKDFCQSDKQTDDLTLIEYTFHHNSREDDKSDNKGCEVKVKPLDWSFQYEFRPESLRSFDPLPLVLQILLECPGLKQYRGRIFTILAEMYNNALDHGVLALDSGLKNSANGFLEYIQERKSRLQNLESGYVRINMEHIPSEYGGELFIEMEDSGSGFDANKIIKTDNSFSGRGLELIRSLCHSVKHSPDGRKVKAIFRWQHS
ncbi:MAG: fused response regulator/phosphatase [Gammaproteobacteria bacterium]|nr:fused response regulator/phosphatase [Gammaproteobacteria bacterium]